MQSSLVLMVEDNPDDEALTLRALRKSNLDMQVDVVRDGVEALAYLFGGMEAGGREPGPLPQVMLLDLKLPKMTGLEILRRVRANARTRLMPVVVLTTSNEERDLIESYGLGANSYIRKPVDFGQFMETVRQLGIYWLTMNEIPPNTDS